MRAEDGKQVWRGHKHGSSLAGQTAYIRFSFVTPPQIKTEKSGLASETNMEAANVYNACTCS